VSSFGDVRADMAAKLAAAGLAGVTLDPAALAPFVLVDLATVDTAEGVGAWGATVPVKIVVPPPGDADAVAALEAGLEVVLVTLGFARAVPGRYTTGDGKELPSYTCTYAVHIPNPNC
jgi:hypothetical protein